MPCADRDFDCRPRPNFPQGQIGGWPNPKRPAFAPTEVTRELQAFGANVYRFEALLTALKASKRLVLLVFFDMDLPSFRALSLSHKQSYWVQRRFTR